MTLKFHCDTDTVIKLHTVKPQSAIAIHGCGHCLHCTDHFVKTPSLVRHFNSISPLRPYPYLQRECRT